MVSIQYIVNLGKLQLLNKEMTNHIKQLRSYSIDEPFKPTNNSYLTSPNRLVIRKIEQIKYVEEEEKKKNKALVFH